MVADVKRRFKKIAKAITALVVDENAFGIQSVQNVRWSFDTNAQKVRRYREWLTEQVNAGVLEVADEFTNEPWLAPYIDDAYSRGSRRAFVDAQRAAGLAVDDLGATYEQFMESSFRVRTASDQLERLYLRTFTALQNVTSQMDQNMSRVLSDGLSQGQGARTIAQNLRREVGVSSRRAERIARTEIVYSHAEGQLDGFEAAGLHDVTIMAEWSTAGDDRVCPLCRPLQGVVLTVKEARGLLPRHPNCRCAFIPAFDDEARPNQSRTKRGLTTRIERSLQAERPRRPLRENRERSRWRGADINPTAKPVTNASADRLTQTRYTGKPKPYWTKARRARLLRQG